MSHIFRILFVRCFSFGVVWWTHSIQNIIRSLFPFQSCMMNTSLFIWIGNRWWTGLGITEGTLWSERLVATRSSFALLFSFVVFDCEFIHNLTLHEISLSFSLFMFVSRISAKDGDGKLILSRTQGEPAFFTFGKSEVGNSFLHFFCLFFCLLFVLLFSQLICFL